MADPSEIERLKNARQTREMNKVCRSIYDKNGLLYGPKDVDGKELSERFARAVDLSENAINRIIRSLERAQAVQLCFLMDATGSMQSHIQAVRLCINIIVDTLYNKSVTAIPMNGFAVAFVGYRDIKDAKRFEILDFITDVDKFKDFCNGIVATGGGDAPEDVFGGLVEVTKLNWRPEYGTHVVFHMADSPCHGTEYHDNLKDDYPLGDPDGNNIQDIFEKINDKSIQYYFGRITNLTDIMIRKFSEYFNESIISYDVQEAAKICESVVKSVEESISKTVKETASDVNPNRRKRRFKIDKTVPNWDDIETLICPLLCYRMPENLDAVLKGDPIQRDASASFHLKVAPNPFAHGTERLAYYGLNIISSEKVDIILKEMIYDDRKESIYYEIPAQMQAVAAFMAKEFNKEAKETKKIIILEARVVQLSGKDKFMAVEKKFENPKFFRFTNNAEYKVDKVKAQEDGVGDYVDLVMAFSHWTFHTTAGAIMVVDIEGTVDQNTGDLLITDPGIHAKNPTLYQPLNLSEKGMAMFFSNHQCNEICQRLRLKDPRNYTPPSWLAEAKAGVAPASGFSARGEYKTS